VSRPRRPHATRPHSQCGRARGRRDRPQRLADVQEYYKGEAEDHFKVLSLLGRNALLTKEWTPLEPGVIDHKLYVRGIGVVLEQAERGGNERNELISFSRSQ
jgi:hypothetical protein